MRVFLDLDVLKWLAQLLGLEQSEFVYTLNNNGRCEVRSQQVIEDLGLGVALGQVLKAIKGLNPGVVGAGREAVEKLDLLKKVRSGGAKVYNWNILFEQLQKFLDLKVEKGKPASPETRDLILADDHQSVADLLSQVFMKCKLRGLRMQVAAHGPLVAPAKAQKEQKKAQSTASGPDLSGKDDSQGLLNRLNRSTQSEQKVPGRDDLYRHELGGAQELNLETFDPFVEYSEAPNCLGFVILAICKNVQVNALQAASLLANGNKYFSQLLVKGKKGLFQPIVALLADVYKHLPVLLRLAEQEEAQGSVKFVLQAFKGCFHSQSLEVAKVGCRIYSKLLYDLANRDFLADAWEW